MKALLAIVAIAGVIAWAGSSHGDIVLGVPLFACIVLVVFAVQWLAFVPAYLCQTERYYDLTGALTYIGAVWLAYLFCYDNDTRSLVLTVLITLWALRLGTFLFRRVSNDGGDSRFDKIKPSALLFFRTWTLQGLWVTVTAGAALAAITSGNPEQLTPADGIGVLMWLLGFGLETVADRQKRQFRERQGSSGFITTGLWSFSRHPNYLGEILLWCGIALIALPSLQGWQNATLISPVFTYLLLTRVSGIPLLEAKAERNWGDDPDYQAYKQSTPVLFPTPRNGA